MSSILTQNPPFDICQAATSWLSKPSSVFDCWLCPECNQPMMPTTEYVGGRGFLPHLQCGNPACMFSCSEAYMIRKFGFCGKATAPIPQTSEEQEVSAAFPMLELTEAAELARQIVAGKAAICAGCNSILDLTLTTRCAVCDMLADAAAAWIGDIEYGRHVVYYAHY